MSECDESENRNDPEEIEEEDQLYVTRIGRIRFQTLGLTIKCDRYYRGEMSLISMSNDRIKWGIIILLIGFLDIFYSIVLFITGSFRWNPK